VIVAPRTGEIDAPAFAVLMAVRIKGRATPAALAMATGMTEDDVRAAVRAARERGLLQAASGSHAGAAAPDEVVALAPDGLHALGALLAAEPCDRGALARAYDGFLTTDTALKDAITAWQLASGEAERGGRGAALRAAGAEATAVAERLAALAPRYASYARRLGAALAALRAGDERYAASPRVDSLHQVWFELHQDLLLTLGRERDT
jgi:hypothetical protein